MGWQMGNQSLRKYLLLVIGLSRASWPSETRDRVVRVGPAAYFFSTGLGTGMRTLRSSPRGSSLLPRPSSSFPLGPTL